MATLINKNAAAQKRNASIPAAPIVEIVGEVTALENSLSAPSAPEDTAPPPVVEDTTPLPPAETPEAKEEREEKEMKAAAKVRDSSLETIVCAVPAINNGVSLGGIQGKGTPRERPASQFQIAVEAIIRELRLLTVTTPSIERPRPAEDIRKERNEIMAKATALTAAGKDTEADAMLDTIASVKKTTTEKGGNLLLSSLPPNTPVLSKSNVWREALENDLLKPITALLFPQVGETSNGKTNGRDGDE